MKSHTNRSLNTMAHVLVLTAGSLLVVGLGANLSGCDRDSSGTSNVREGANQISSISAGGPVAPVSTQSNKVYSDLVASLKPMVSELQGSAQGAASAVLVNYAQVGLSFEPAEAVLDLERDALNQASGVRSALNDWQSATILEASAKGFDPAPQLREIEEQRQAQTRQIEELKTKKADTDRRIAELRNQASEKLKEADVYAKEFAQAEEEISKLSATEAAPKTEAAHARKREGDKIRKEGDKLNARADVIVPESQEIQLLIDASTKMVEKLDQTKLQVNERAQQQRAAAADAAARAGEAASAIKSRVEALEKLRSEQLKPKHDEVTAALRNAIETARSAGNDKSSSGKLAMGRAQQSLADAQLAIAQSYGIHAGVLESLVAAQPPLPTADSYATLAKSARAAEREALNAAAESYESAQSTFSAIQVKGAPEVKERLDALAEKLGKMAAAAKGVTPEATPSEAAPAGTEGTDAATTDRAASAQAANEIPADLAEAIEKFIATAESGDTEAARAMTKFSSDQVRTNFDAMAKVGEKVKKLNDLARDKFGTALSDLPPSGGMSIGGGFSVLPPGSTLKDLNVAVNGDTAKVAPKGIDLSGPMADTLALSFVKEEGRWLWDPTSMLSGPMAGMMLAMLPAVGAAYDDVIAKINDGTITSTKDAADAVQKNVMGAMGGGMGGMGNDAPGGEEPPAGSTEPAPAGDK